MIYSREKKPGRPRPHIELERRLDKEIAYAAGAEYFDNRDPLYHISEYFTNTFDMAGIRLGAQLSREDGREAPEEADRQFARKTSMDSYFRPSPMERDAQFLSKFSETSFQRGVLASAVYRGTGQMMLFTCLKRTIGQFQPRSERQRMLFGGSVTKDLAGHPGKAVFNRGTVDSAVAMVADVTRDARRLTEALADMAEGENVLPGDSGTNTLRLVYPFLSDRRDREQLEGYRAELDRLSGMEGTEREQAVLRRAIAKAEALIERKRFMRTQFIMKLRGIGDNASAALRDFSDPEYVRAVAETVGAEDPGDGENQE